MTATTSRHVRPRVEGADQPVTAVELLFDLVFVFAVTQLSHLVLDDLTVTGLLRAAFLLLVVWWGWINTTWLANWLEPGSTRVRLVLVGGALASLLLAAAIPRALGSRGLLFAVGYVALQSGRNLAATLLAPRGHRLRLTFARLLFWSILAGLVWIAGGLVDAHSRLIVWGAALAVDLVAPILGYPTPGLGRSRTDDYDIEGGHFAERCQGFVIIALGESIVLTGVTAANAGLNASAVFALILAFIATATLWWLYFDATAENSRADIVASREAGRLARDAYSYLHIPIVAGIVAVAVGDNLLLTHPWRPLSSVGTATALGGPALFLFGESVFRLRMIGSVAPRRLACVAALAITALVSADVSAFALVAIATAMLVALALSEHYAPGPAPARPATGGAGPRPPPRDAQ